mgnify:CR=1 FL=1
MSIKLSALGRAARRFPRTHLILSGALVITVGLIALTPESGESRPARLQTLELPKPSASEELVRQESAQPVADVRAPAETPDEEQWIKITVASGDTLSGLLQSRGVSAAQVHRLVTGDERLAELATIRPGDSLNISVDEAGELTSLRYSPSRVETVEATLEDGNWRVENVVREYQRRTRFAEATIDNSLFLAGHAAGMSDNLTMQLANIFGWDIDFVLDIRNGDRFRVLYEELYLDGEKVGVGNILAAEF